MAWLARLAVSVRATEESMRRAFSGIFEWLKMDGFIVSAVSSGGGVVAFAAQLFGIFRPSSSPISATRLSRFPSWPQRFWMLPTRPTEAQAKNPERMLAGLHTAGVKRQPWRTRRSGTGSYGCRYRPSESSKLSPRLAVTRPSSRPNGVGVRSHLNGGERTFASTKSTVPGGSGATINWGRSAFPAFATP